MSNNNPFISGENITLKRLFTGDNKIIIPDLQRDYCWGDDSHTDEKKDLVTDFVKGLISQFDNTESLSNDTLNLGLIYGYESPRKHIQLCDGQQRITTLFLLVGVLNKRLQNNSLKQYLISDFEYSQDDKEPYLQYSIRESSLYFLSDLVCHYFIHSETDLEYVDSIDGIKNSSWFFNEYHTDPSILSMLKAISKIESILGNKTVQWCLDFGDYLVNKLTFMYYDMGNRKNGEETFVVINTTGEPLSPTQNLKPLIIAKNSSYPNISRCWEEIETWFWQKRKNDNDTADAGFNEFLRWVTLLHSDYDVNQEEVKEILAKGRYSFPKESISFDKIYATYENVKFLFETWKYKDKLDKDRSLLSPMPNKEADNLRCISQINCFLLLPLIKYCNKWNVKDGNDEGLCRLFQFLKNLTRLPNVAKKVNDFVFEAIFIAQSYRDVVDVLNDLSTISSTILTQEERLKLQIIKESTNRESVENAFWRTQEHKIWEGQIMPLIQWATEDGNFSLAKFELYDKIFNKVFNGECGSEIDIVRRALLTRGLNEYPRIFKGYTNLSFGWEWDDWNVLINDNIDLFKRFFDEFDNDSPIDEVCNKLIMDFVNSPEIGSAEYADFIKYEYLMAYCGEKNIQRDTNQGVLLLKKKRTSGAYLSLRCKHLENYLRLKKEDGTINNGWDIQDSGSGSVILKYQDPKIEIYDHQEKWIVRSSFNGRCEEKQIDIEQMDENGIFIYPKVLEMLKNDTLNNNKDL